MVHLNYFISALPFIDISLTFDILPCHCLDFQGKLLPSGKISLLSGKTAAKNLEAGRDLHLFARSSVGACEAVQ